VGHIPALRLEIMIHAAKYPTSDQLLISVCLDEAQALVDQANSKQSAIAAFLLRVKSLTSIHLEISPTTAEQLWELFVSCCTRKKNVATEVGWVSVSSPMSGTPHRVLVLVAVWSEYLHPSLAPITTKGETWEAVFEFSSKLTDGDRFHQVRSIIQVWSNWYSQIEFDHAAVSDPAGALKGKSGSELVQRIWPPLLVPFGGDFWGQVRYSESSLLITLPPYWETGDADADLRNFLSFRKLLVQLVAAFPEGDPFLFWGPNAEEYGGSNIPLDALNDIQALDGIFRRLHLGSARKAISTVEIAMAVGEDKDSRGPGPA